MAINTFICRDHSKLLKCYCKVSALGGQLPDKLKQEWQETNKALLTLYDVLQSIGSIVSVKPELPREGDPCEILRKFLEQLKRLCKALEKSGQPDGELKALLEKAEKQWKEFEEKFAKLLAHLNKLDMNPCRDDGGNGGGGELPEGLDPGPYEDVRQEEVNSGVTMLQSKYLYLQAAGSDMSDGSANGMHLRWSFRDKLAEEHLPKGSLASAAGSPFYTTIAHNRPDDYVYLKRLFYTDKGAPVLDFSKPPALIVTTSWKRHWKYNISGFSGKPVPVTVRFKDIQKYDGIGIDPNAKPLDFIKSYDGLLEVQVDDSLLFAVEFTLEQRPSGCSLLRSSSATDANLRFEFISVPYDGVDAPHSISCRETTSHNDTGKPLTKKHFCENILYTRFQVANGYVTKMRLEPYRDYLNSGPAADHLGKFSLTTQQPKAYQRLEDPARFVIDQKWPQFNDGTTVRTKNYEDKWIDPANGLWRAVQEYLWRSKTDIYAIAAFNSSQPNDTAVLPVSYLSLLNMTGSDYHIARMLGLGHIDTPTDADPNRKYIYLATYVTKNAALGQDSPGQSPYTVQAYMTLPTARVDHRLPITPQAEPVSYGLNISGNSAPQLFDEHGYSHFYDVRFIKLKRKKYPYEITFQNFFQQTEEFCTCEHTFSLLYGIEYKKQGAPAYVKPEITSLLPPAPGVTQYLAWDTDFAGGVPETIPVRDDENALFVHSETQEGFHCYAIYGINWFSRPSAVSNEVCTDETRFPKKNTLLPPSNVGVQYIQEEDPLVFTSQAEQLALTARETASPGADNCVTRVTFDYHHVHNNAYQRGNELHFYFRENPPAERRGKVTSVTSGGTPNRALIYTGSYNTPDLGVMNPFIAPADTAHFTGSLFACEGDQYLIVSVQSLPAGPVFEVEMIPTTVVYEQQETDPSGHTVTSYTNTNGLPKSPQINQKFSVVENLSDPARWTKLARTEPIVHFSSYTEDRTLEDGTTVTENFGGIIGQATVDASSSIPGIEGVTGLFRATFNTETLADHPGDAEWNKGVARAITATGKMKLCEVIKIESQSPLVIWIYDSAPTDDPLLTGANHAVNFHPGYRVYLSPEPAKNFDRAHIMPASANTKKTFIGVQTADTTMSPDYESPVCPPVVLLAQKIQVPVPPALPLGPTFATRPDFYGKSTYTFDTAVNTSGGRTPFSLIFYRADDQALLDALYTAATVTTIRDALAALDPNEFTVNRFSDLANVVLDTDPSFAGQFKSYDGYRFPQPNKPGLLTGGETSSQKTAKLKAAINKVFVPLTKNPPVYEFIKTGRQTEGSAPVLYDSAGNLLPFSDPDFNPFPMARKFTDSGTTYVRFTDYTLDGTSVNMFFYFAVEMSSQLKMSERSPVAGPIMLVNAYPPEAPVIKTVFPKPADIASGTTASVFFTVEPYLESERITHFRIFRSTDAGSVLSVRNMTLVTECLAGEVIDPFDDVEYPPYGEVIYYRLVALRTIINEQGEEEWIPSKPSAPFVTNMLDMVNPSSPEISHSFASIDADKNLHEVTLQWEPTCYNGTYHVYKQSKAGNWMKFYSVKSNEPMAFPPGGDFATYTDTALLPKLDEDGNLVYHRFRIGVENASGLMNVKYRECTV